MKNHRSRRHALMVRAAAPALALALVAGAAGAQESRRAFEIAPQPLADALLQFARQADIDIVAAADLTRGRTAPAVRGELTAAEAMTQLLAGSGLEAQPAGGGLILARADAPQGGSAAGGGAEVEALIVTAQKKEENIQDVPIAISAFSAEALEAQKIEGGFDLLKAIPNVTFSKNNFSSYNFSIRGVGTKAISATTDPGVAVAFNNTTLIQNRLFEQEYFDLERVEVLRGPQGTLYGRNATSGVINVISAKPRLAEFEASLKGEVGNYSTKRLSGMINIPVVEDVLAVRLAGALTKRDGYDYNSVTNHAVNGRDLWSTRLTVGFEPTERFRANLIWEHFQEDDDRSRTGKQLCHRDPGASMVGNQSTAIIPDSPYDSLLGPALFAQGCLPGNLYDDAAFATPNGLALSFIFGHLLVSAQPGSGQPVIRLAGVNGDYKALLQVKDPYGGMMQSRDLRTIASFRDPSYRAKADLYELNLDFDLTETLTLFSQTTYNNDEVYSFQDYNRFNTLPVFSDTSTFNVIGGRDYRNLAPGGVFCDPQLGCSDTIAGFDISQADGRQFSQEFRLQSAFDGPINFSVGANYTEFKTLIDYYVMYNIITAMAMAQPFNVPINGVIDYVTCANSNFGTLTPSISNPVPIDDPRGTCPYIDPNPVESINGEGHNYFRSKNPYKLKSWAGFGEFYWNITDAVKLTAGLRYTKDIKTFVPVPSQVLLAPGMAAGGTVSRGYPEDPPIKQKWGEWTGRLGMDWKGATSFTDETLLYAFYSRGYKGGGANPPQPGFADLDEFIATAEAAGLSPLLIQNYINLDLVPLLELTAVEYGRTFDPEFVNAFEVGSKNTLLNGAMTLNATAFYYDYEDYQVSQIRDRTAVNENFDAKIWGLEFEALFSPTRDLRIIANLGYLDTSIADGESSIDIMNRTQGDPDFIIAKPWPQLPSNCVVPVAVAEEYFRKTAETGRGLSGSAFGICGGVGGLIGAFGSPDDPATGVDYDPAYYDGTNGTVDLNGGAGIRDELGGNELPNAPHWTANIGAQYTFDMEAWRLTFRGDAYWQSQSWHRVYNTDPYDKLHGWYNLNLSAWLEFPEHDMKVEFYVKNVLDKTPITDAFLNSDDTGLTTNVFVLDPRLIGLSVRKGF